MKRTSDKKQHHKIQGLSRSWNKQAKRLQNKGSRQKWVRQVKFMVG